MEQPRVPGPDIVYGRIIYWLCIVAASISVLGPALTIFFPGNTYMDPELLFFNIWQGMGPEAIWQQTGGGFPGGHFWLTHIGTWDGMTQVGLVIGCSGAFLALLATSVAFVRARPRSYGWAVVSLFVSLMVLFSAVGIVTNGVAS